MHIPFFGPIILIILFGIGFLVVDKLISKFSGKDRVIMGNINRALKKISGENILVEFVIILGVPFLAIYSLSFFSDENFLYWFIVAIEIAFFSYLGAKWLENL